MSYNIYIYILIHINIYIYICQSVASALNEEESARAKCANLWPKSYTQLAAELNLGNASAHSLYFIRISRPWLGRDDCFQQKVRRLPQNARCRKEKQSSEGLQAQMANINTKRMSPHQINPILPKRSQKHSAARLRRLQISTLAGSNSASLWVVRMEKSNMKSTVWRGHADASALLSLVLSSTSATSLESEGGIDDVI